MRIKFKIICPPHNIYIICDTTLLHIKKECDFILLCSLKQRESWDTSPDGLGIGDEPALSVQGPVAREGLVIPIHPVTVIFQKHLIQRIIMSNS